VIELGVKVRENADLEQRLTALEHRLANEEGGQGRVK
jgi:BMFP domain-containing protein YqiC